MSQLKKPIMLERGVNNSFKRFGGQVLDAAVLDRCFDRLIAWMRLLGRSLLAEFPSWELHLILHIQIETTVLMV